MLGDSGIEKFLVRKASPPDAGGIARVHVDGWRTTYRGIVPQAHLDSLSYASSENYWRGRLASPEAVLFVADGGGGGDIVGFACGGEERTKKFPSHRGELYAIYLLPEHRGKSLGRRLFARVAEALVEKGYDSMLVWVLALNPYRQFYERLGGEKLATQSITIGGSALEEWAYGWKDLRGLALGNA
jgi:GNAT superfamily N-acetyltransferase